MTRIAHTTRNGGFTLIEIMIVVMVIGILLAMAVPNFVRARQISRSKSCIANLRQIQTAKDQWAMEYKQADNATPADMAVLTIDDPANNKGAYLKSEMTCPSGGMYVINPINTHPACDFVDATAPHNLAAGGG